MATPTKKGKADFNEMTKEDFARQTAFEVFQDPEAFISKEAFKQALAKAFQKNKNMSKEAAESLAQKVEVGLAMGKGQDPLKSEIQNEVMNLSTLRERLTESAITSFALIFGSEKGKAKAEEFVSLLIGTEEDEKNFGKEKPKALLFQMAEQIQSLLQIKKDTSIGEIEELMKETLIQSLAEQARPDLDAFVLNEALLANGNKLLSTVHDALISNIGGSEEGLNIPIQI